MAGEVLDLKSILTEDSLAVSIAHSYADWNNQRQIWLDQQQELRNYLFATDTRTTTNQTLEWKNTTTVPKLTQIRDNLHANYMAALFPNENWLVWEAFTKDDAKKAKKKSIEAYIRTKLNDSGFRKTVAQLLYDYIDYGNAFADVIFEDESKEDPETGELLSGYVGPKLVRISPYDIVFNPAAIDFASSPKIVRKLISFGEMEVQIQERPEDATWLRKAFKESRDIRSRTGSFDSEDFEKAFAFSIDGFGSIYSYFSSGFVEVLEFEGDAYDPNTETLYKDHVITVIDRTKVVRVQPHPVWVRRLHKFHAGWRTRPDNLYAMGPLHNLVGMQYRIDHLENLKADVFDLIAFPPIKIVGDVQEFVWKPMEQIFVDEGGDVQMLAPDSQALNADFQIQLLETKMEEFAGAPKEAMGIRTPGEKTAFEVSQLVNASGRIFQEKVEQFEIDLLEPAVNAMLETGRRNLNPNEIARLKDDEFGITEFLDINQDDISGQGRLRPKGARHFTTQSQLVQTLVGLLSSPLGEALKPHINSKKLALFVEDTLGMDRFELFSPNAQVYEEIERQKIIQVASRELELRELMLDDVDELAEKVATAAAIDEATGEGEPEVPEPTPGLPTPGLSSEGI